jgi:GMP synthase-like glutamine amidotransferase
MKIAVINNNSKFLQELINYLPGEVSVIDRENLDQTDLKTYEMMILSGGHRMPIVTSTEEAYQAEINLVKELPIPILGICLGAEIINVAFGGTLKRLEQKLSGEYMINITNPELKSFVGDTMQVEEAHVMAVDQLADCLEACASSNSGVEVFKHKTKPILALQFHPELSNNTEFKKWIFSTIL